MAGMDGVMALAGVEGAIGGDAGDLLIGRDLVQKFRQHGRVADVAGGELDRPDFQRLLVDRAVDLAPDTALRAAMLARSSGKPLRKSIDPPDQLLLLAPGLLSDPPHSTPLHPRP